MYICTHESIPPARLSRRRPGCWREPSAAVLLFVHIYTHMYICIHMYVDLLCTCMYIYIYICKYTYVYVRIYIYIYTRVYVHIYIYIYIHAYIVYCLCNPLYCVLVYGACWCVCMLMCRICWLVGLLWLLLCLLLLLLLLLLQLLLLLLLWLLCMQTFIYIDGGFVGERTLWYSNIEHHNSSCSVESKPLTFRASNDYFTNNVTAIIINNNCTYELSRG